MGWVVWEYCIGVGCMRVLHRSGLYGSTVWGGLYESTA